MMTYVEDHRTPITKQMARYRSPPQSHGSRHFTYLYSFLPYRSRPRLRSRPSQQACGGGSGSFRAGAHSAPFHRSPFRGPVRGHASLQGQASVPVSGRSSAPSREGSGRNQSPFQADTGVFTRLGAFFDRAHIPGSYRFSPSVRHRPRRGPQTGAGSVKATESHGCRRCSRQ